MWFKREDEKQQTGTQEDDGLKEILADARLYLEKRIELFMLGFVERLTFLLADAIQRIAGLVIFSLGAFFLWFALSFIVGDWVNSDALGFLITSIPLLLGGGMFLWIQPGRIRRMIQAGMIRQFLRAFDESLASVRPEGSEAGDAGSARSEGAGRGSKTSSANPSTGADRGSDASTASNSKEGIR